MTGAIIEAGHSELRGHMFRGRRSADGSTTIQRRTVPLQQSPCNRTPATGQQRPATGHQAFNERPVNAEAAGTALPDYEVVSGKANAVARSRLEIASRATIKSPGRPRPSLRPNVVRGYVMAHLEKESTLSQPRAA
ncbi:hypothetical protein K239x_21850 [Planctomycetes bacterium K23_9]|uniref:Uncharacterized protein n=1 Tax=Stieleria marina TaxID=1930275 RepID=A0A517NSZ2_9BACT|nr:hypothetical protein K239x_21850 [Planctomycetes bacterium K23_9]